MHAAVLALKNSRLIQRGINMVDLMMWLVIAALLLAAAIQGIGYYQKNAYVYQMREAVDVASSRIMALASNSGSVNYDDAVAVVNDQNAANPNSNITLTVENISLTAAAEPGATDYGFALASAVTTAPTASETFFIRAVHTAVSDEDVVHYFKDTATKRAGTYLENLGSTTSTTTGSGTTSGSTTSTPTATATATPTPTPTATTAPALTVLTLTQQQNSQALNYYGVALSADGNQMIAGSNVGYIYRSTDAGTTWTALTSAGSRGWYGLASSGDGTKLIGTTNTGYVFISNDSGATWTQTSLPSAAWTNIAMTPDGSKIIVGQTSSNTGRMYVSKDGGVTWNVQKGSNGADLLSDYRSVSLSDDGMTMVAGSISYANIWLSKDGGTTWTAAAPYYSNKYYGVAVSADGKTIAAGRLSGGLSISKDGGSTWATPGGVNSDNYHVSMSADGSKIMATGGTNNSTQSPNAVYVSKDFGDTFTQQTQVGTAAWWNSAISRDGSKLIFGSISGKKLWTGVWTAQ